MAHYAFTTKRYHCNSISVSRLALTLAVVLAERTLLVPHFTTHITECQNCTLIRAYTDTPN